MTEPLERDDIVGLLKRLGNEPDEEVLEAARQVHARITAAGMTWDDLLIPDQADDETEDFDEADDSDDTDDADDAEYENEEKEENEENEEDEGAEPTAETAGKNAETLTLIGKLLAKSGISQDLRDELEGYKTDIAEGDFREADRQYLQAISERLSKRR